MSKNFHSYLCIMILISTTQADRNVSEMENVLNKIRNMWNWMHDNLKDIKNRETIFVQPSASKVIEKYTNLNNNMNHIEELLLQKFCQDRSAKGEKCIDSKKEYGLKIASICLHSVPALSNKLQIFNNLTACINEHKRERDEYIQIVNTFIEYLTNIERSIKSTAENSETSNAYFEVILKWNSINIDKTNKEILFKLQKMKIIYKNSRKFLSDCIQNNRLLNIIVERSIRSEVQDCMENLYSNRQPDSHP